MPEKLIQLEENEDYFVNWIFYISKDHKHLLKKGTYQGYWRFYKRKVDGHLWTEIKDFPEHFEQLTEEELADYLEGKVYWTKLTIESDPFKIHYKFGEVAGKMKYYALDNNGHWQRLHDHENEISKQAMIFIPGNIDLNKFDYEYLFVSGDTKHLFRKSKYEGHDVFFVKVSDKDWKQISFLPDNCQVFHIKNTPFEEIIKKRRSWKWTFYKDPQDADWIYKKGMKDGRQVYLKKRVGNLWQKVHHDNIPENLETMKKDEEIIDWLFYILEDDSTVVFRKGLINEQWHFYSKKTHGGNWEEMQDAIPDNAILVNEPDSPEDQVDPIFWVFYVQMGMSDRLFRASKQKGHMIYQEKTKDAKGWKKIKQLPENTFQITKDAYFYSRVQYNWKYYVNPNDENSVFKITEDEGTLLIFKQSHDKAAQELQSLPEHSILINETKDNFSIDMIWKHYVDPRDVDVEYKIAIVNSQHYHFVNTFNMWKEIKQIPFTCITVQEWARIQANEKQEDSKNEFPWRYKRIKTQPDWLYREGKDSEEPVYESKYQNNNWHRINQAIDRWTDIPKEDSPIYSSYWVYGKCKSSHNYDCRKKRRHNDWEYQQYSKGYWRECSSFDDEVSDLNYSQIPQKLFETLYSDQQVSDSQMEQIEVQGYKEFDNPKNSDFKFVKVEMPKTKKIEYIYLNSYFQNDDSDSDMEGMTGIFVKPEDLDNESGSFSQSKTLNVDADGNEVRTVSDDINDEVDDQIDENKKNSGFDPEDEFDGETDDNRNKIQEEIDQTKSSNDLNDGFPDMKLDNSSIDDEESSINSGFEDSQSGIQAEINASRNDNTKDLDVADENNGFDDMKVGNQNSGNSDSGSGFPDMEMSGSPDLEESSGSSDSGFPDMEMGGSQDLEGSGGSSDSGFPDMEMGGSQDLEGSGDDTPMVGMSQSGGDDETGSSKGRYPDLFGRRLRTYENKHGEQQYEVSHHKRSLHRKLHTRANFFGSRTLRRMK